MTTYTIRFVIVLSVSDCRAKSTRTQTDQRVVLTSDGCTHTHTHTHTGYRPHRPGITSQTTATLSANSYRSTQMVAVPYIMREAQISLLYQSGCKTKQSFIDIRLRPGITTPFMARHCTSQPPPFGVAPITAKRDFIHKIGSA